MCTRTYLTANLPKTPLRKCLGVYQPLFPSVNPIINSLRSPLKSPLQKAHAFLSNAFQLRLYSSLRAKDERPKDENIKSSTISLISETGEAKGIFSLAKILSEMNRKEQILVQVNNNFPPCCRIFLKKELYEKAKAIKKQNSIGAVKTKTFKISYNISEHDLQVKVNQCKKIFAKGDVVIFILLVPEKGIPKDIKPLVFPLYKSLEEKIGESGKIIKEFKIQECFGTFTVQGKKVIAQDPN